MPYLKVEAKISTGWVPVGSPLRKGDRPGSVSNNTGKGRELILFACQGDRSLVLRSRNGFDIEKGDARSVISEGFDRLAVLAAGETYQMSVTIVVFGITVPVRWTHVQE